MSTPISKWTQKSSGNRVEQSRMRKYKRMLKSYLDQAYELLLCFFFSFFLRLLTGPTQALSNFPLAGFLLKLLPTLCSWSETCFHQLSTPIITFWSSNHRHGNGHILPHTSYLFISKVDPHSKWDFQFFPRLSKTKERSLVFEGVYIYIKYYLKI